MKTMSVMEVLNAIDLFATFSDSEKEELAAMARLHRFDKGATLFTKGEISHAVIIVVEGIVSIYKHDSRGNEVPIGYFHRYALVAEAAVLRRSPLPSSAAFKTDGTIMKIALDGFEAFMLKHPGFAFKIIQSLLEKIDLLQQNIHFGLAATSNEKIINFYRRNPKMAGDLKQYEIASVLGMTPETLSRGIKALLREQKLVKKASGYAVVNDLEG
jgi:CRP-like cAMP-binding protein